MEGAPEDGCGARVIERNHGAQSLNRGHPWSRDLAGPQCGLPEP